MWSSKAVGNNTATHTSSSLAMYPAPCFSPLSPASPSRLALTATAGTHRGAYLIPGLCVNSHHPDAMETFFRRHFGRKGPRRTSVVAVPTGKARRRSQVGLPSASLAQCRRGSGTPAASLSCLGLVRRPGTRRRSSTTPPCLSPRFAVQKKCGGQAQAIDAQLLGSTVLLASLIPTAEEGDRAHCTDSSRSESPEDGGAAAGAEQGQHEHCAEEMWLAMLPQQRPLQAGLLSRGPRCLRRASSHRLPTEVAYGRTAYGLPGRYRRLSQRRRSSGAPQPGLLPSGHARLLAQHCAGVPGTRCPSSTLVKGLGPEPRCHTTPDGWSPRLLYVWWQRATRQCLWEGRGGVQTQVWWGRREETQCRAPAATGVL